MDLLRKIRLFFCFNHHYILQFDDILYRGKRINVHNKSAGKTIKQRNGENYDMLYRNQKRTL